MQRKTGNQINQETDEQSKKRYSKVGYEVRKKLIQKVFEDGMHASSAAKFLKLKMSTAKAIISKFNETGQIFESKKAKQRRLAKKNCQNNEKHPQKKKEKEKLKNNVQEIQKTTKNLISTQDIINCWIKHCFTCIYLKFPYGNQNLF